MFDEARPICVVSVDLDPHGWNHLLFCQNYCQSPPAPVNSSHKEHQDYHRANFKHFWPLHPGHRMREWDCKNIWQKIFWYSQLCSALSLRHCSEDRWYHLNTTGLGTDRQRRNLQKYLHNLTCWQGEGGRGLNRSKRRCVRSSIKVSCCLLWCWRGGGGGVCYPGTLGQVTINVSYLFVQTRRGVIVVRVVRAPRCVITHLPPSPGQPPPPHYNL